MSFECSPAYTEILVSAQVNKTESREKVAEAVSKLFHGAGELKVEESRVEFVSGDMESLRFLRDQFRDRQVRAAARRLLLANMQSESKQTFLLLNKQAATVGIAALCDDPRESQLGPISLRIRSEDLERAIEWITSGYSPEESS